MKRKPFVQMALLFTLISVWSASGQTPATQKSERATVTTNKATTVTSYSAIASAVVESEGSSAIGARGFCWSETVQSPTREEAKSIQVTGGKTMQSYLVCLKPNTTYYLRAFAVNQAGTAYGNTVTFRTLPDDGGTVTDIEGNVYRTIEINGKVWLAENLRTARYNTGDPIPTTDEEIYERENPKYQWPVDGDPANTTSYGRLYTWHVVNDSRGICPCGWHVPTQEEWQELIDFLGGEEVAGAAIKATGTAQWRSPNGGATNASGLAALPSGMRDYTSAFAWFKQSATFWSATENDTDDAFHYTVNHIDTSLLEDVYSKNTGYAVRCVKD